MTLNGSSNNNELVSLGGVPPIVGTTTQQREGYPLNGWWSRKLSGYEDENNNGIIATERDHGRLDSASSVAQASSDRRSRRSSSRSRAASTCSTAASASRRWSTTRAAT